MSGPFAIRIYGKRWLAQTRSPDAGSDHRHGWRPLSWTEDLTDAMKWGTQADAQEFAVLYPFPYEIVDLATSAPAPAGGRIRMVMPQYLNAVAA